MKNSVKPSARARVVAAIAMALVMAGPARAQKASPDPELVAGTAQVAAGQYDAAVITLSSVVRRLSASPGAEAEAARAYLQLGIAFAGLGQASPARSQFVQALMRDPSLSLDPAAVPPLAVEAFTAARAEGERDRVVSTDRRPKGGGSGGKILLGAAVVAAGAGVALAAGGGGGEAPPNPTYIPIVTSPLIELVSASPSPGSQVPVGVAVGLTLKATNAGDRRFIFVAESVTADGRTCFFGQTQPFSTGTSGSVTNGFPLNPQCAAPFTTETLNIWMQDAETGARPHEARYRGGYRVAP